ncbi:MAG: hypothetical protein ACKVOH_02290 [Chlamydiales bacterium]
MSLQSFGVPPVGNIGLHERVVLTQEWVTKEKIDIRRGTSPLYPGYVFLVTPQPKSTDVAVRKIALATIAPTTPEEAKTIAMWQLPALRLDPDGFSPVPGLEGRKFSCQTTGAHTVTITLLSVMRHAAVPVSEWLHESF